jgi:hypothetical protein
VLSIGNKLNVWWMIYVSWWGRNQNHDCSTQTTSPSSLLPTFLTAVHVCQWLLRVFSATREVSERLLNWAVLMPRRMIDVKKNEQNSFLTVAKLEVMPSVGKC